MCPVALDGAAHAARHGETEPRTGVVVGVVLARERIQDEEPVPLRTTLAINALELRAAGQPAAAGSAIAH